MDADVYTFLVSIVGIAAGVGCALATSYGPLLVTRIFVGIGTSPGMGIGASVVSDLYYMHERGRYFLPEHTNVPQPRIPLPSLVIHTVGI